MLSFPEYPDSELNYLNRADVLRACAEVDICAVVEHTLRAHAAGDCVIPEEAYLGWRTASGHSARSLAMQGAIHGDDGIQLGMKVINGSLANPANGIARSQGLLMLFDPEIAWPHTLMEAAYVSAMRTAAVTAVSAAHLGPASMRQLALLGCGTLARAHLALLPGTLPTLRTV